MAIELITCPACGTKNASHRTVCLKCGMNLADRKESTPRIYKAEETAKAILSAGPALFREIQQLLGDREIRPEWFVEFTSELACYVLHLQDRKLSDVERAGFLRNRVQLMNDLMVAICQTHHAYLTGSGYEITLDDVMAAFITMYNYRRLEYDVFSEDWLVPVSLRFGQHAADALEAPEEERDKLAAACALLAPAVFKDLIPFLPSGFEQ